jgi:hypothetical protein
VNGGTRKIGHYANDNARFSSNPNQPTAVSRIIVLGEAHLRRILRCYARYYNEIRTHRALNKDAPRSRAVQQVGIIKSLAILGGLHHQYVQI